MSDACDVAVYYPEIRQALRFKHWVSIVKMQVGTTQGEGISPDRHKYCTFQRI